MQAHRENHRVALFHREFEETRDKLVLGSLIATFHFADVEHVVVPMRDVRVFRRPAELQEQPRIVLVELPRRPVFHHFHLAAGIVVLVREHVDVAEGQKRLHTQSDGCHGFAQGVAHEESGFGGGENQFLVEHHVADAVGELRHGVGGEVAEVFVSTRREDAVGVHVHAKVELLLVLDNGLVEARQQDVVVVVQLRLRNH